MDERPIARAFVGVLSPAEIARQGRPQHRGGQSGNIAGGGVLAGLARRFVRLRGRLPDGRASAGE